MSFDISALGADFLGSTAPPAITVTEGSSITLPAVSSVESAAFTWYDAATSVGAPNQSYTPTQSITLKLVLNPAPAPVQYTVSFDISALGADFLGATAPPAIIQSKPNASITLPSILDVNPVLYAWYDGTAQAGAPEESYTPTKNITLYARTK